MLAIDVTACCSFILRRSRLLRVLLLTAFLQHATAYAPPAKFLIVSEGGTGALYYMKLPETPSTPGKMSVLVAAGNGLVHPQGLAVDQKRSLLLVADSGTRKVVSYGLYASGNTLYVDEQTPVAEDVDARWVTVDGRGNVFFTEEIGNRIMRVAGGAEGAKIAKIETLLQKDAGVSALSAPGGIATDNHYVYWTNKVNGKGVGSVVRALQAVHGLTNLTKATSNDLKLKSLSNGIDKSYGVCIAMDQVFYTDTDTRIWGVKKGGDVQAVALSENMSFPRGCAWDGRNTVYVADRGLNGVFAFRAPMVSLAETEMIKVAELQEAFGVAVFSGALRRSATTMLVLQGSLLIGLLTQMKP
eukprot:TRINITY_DN9047_c1_g1_i1.p1 TRINITY_DN9047_c1_g1~~TRINITY_DN9047_c1_g1_i1.p1  ORF type:complete len:357 (+),score=56.14 TRINITY_DN9047_c1_g1_i1:206-1276(+)